MKLWITIEIDTSDPELDWGSSVAIPTDNGVGGQLYEFDISLKYCGIEVVNCDYDAAETHLIELRKERAA